MSPTSRVTSVTSKKMSRNSHCAGDPGTSTASMDESETSLVDPIWETLDPTPDIHGLFLLYNDMFFKGALGGCEVKWSPRMTSCAGVCSYEGKGGLCSIRLSKPLLILRPRKDLVETLLHEMIHAYLFVTVRNRDRDGHGPEFQFHMRRINARAKTNITIYHTFFAEVANYKQHWWRCNGFCRNRRPFFGWVKRASNRAPGPNDLWWSQHQRSCGGKFEKIKEPENFRDGKLAKQKSLKIGKTRNMKKDSLLNSVSTDVKKNAVFSGKSYVLGSGLSTQQSSSIGLPDKSTSNSVGLSQSVLDHFLKKEVQSQSISSTSSLRILSSPGPVITLDDCDNKGELAAAFKKNNSFVSCPSCSSIVLESAINSHLDECLS